MTPAAEGPDWAGGTTAVAVYLSRAADAPSMYRPSPPDAAQMRRSPDPRRRSRRGGSWCGGGAAPRLPRTELTRFEGAAYRSCRDDICRSRLMAVSRLTGSSEAPSSLPMIASCWSRFSCGSDTCSASSWMYEKGTGGGSGGGFGSGLGGGSLRMADQLESGRLARLGIVDHLEPGDLRRQQIGPHRFNDQRQNRLAQCHRIPAFRAARCPSSASTWTPRR